MDSLDASSRLAASEDGDGTGEEVLVGDSEDEDGEAHEGMGDNCGEVTTLCGHVTRGISSQRGNDLTDTCTDDILPTSINNIQIST